MKKNRWLLRLVTLVVISCGLMTAAMAAEVGSSGDPLVTLSYLNEVFLEEVLDRVDSKIDERNRDIAKELGSQTGSTGGAGFLLLAGVGGTAGAKGEDHYKCQE